MNIGTTIAREAVIQFPETPTRTLAQKIYNDNPSVFLNFESARTIVRTARKNKKMPICPFDSLPKGMLDFKEWEPYVIDERVVLIICDLHIPYHNKESLKIALEYAQHIGISAILFMGDCSDFYSVSRWDKDPRNRNFQKEIDTVQDILDSIRQAFPDIGLYYLIGNHEERLERYLRVKAPELLGYRALDYSEIIDARQFDIKIIDQKRIVKIDTLNCIHGHEFGRSISNPVNPARGLYLRGKETAICGHFHQSSQHTEKSMTNKVTTCWSVGCLCDLRPEYLPMNKWNHGFAIVIVTDDGFQVLNKNIINGKVF